MHKTAFIWSDKYSLYSFPGNHPFKAMREFMTKKLLEERLAFLSIDMIEPPLIPEEILYLVHDKDYVRLVKEMDEKGNGLLDEGDTPAFKGIFEGALIRTSGTLYAMKLLMDGKYEHTVNIGGGFHHAKRNKAEGFCVFNDLALAIKIGEEKFNRIALVDIDGHHGDGTQEILKDDPKSLKISLHMFHPNFFPGTGNLNEIGEAEGEGSIINIPLPPGTGDDAYIFAFREIVIPSIERFKPEVILIMNGGDSHYNDPLVELKLSTYGYLEVIKELHTLAHKYADGRILMTGGGGYNYDATAREWTVTVAEIAGIYDTEYEILHDPEKTTSNDLVWNKVKDFVKKVKEIHGL